MLRLVLPVLVLVFFVACKDNSNHEILGAGGPQFSSTLRSLIPEYSSSRLRGPSRDSYSTSNEPYSTGSNGLLAYGGTLARIFGGSDPESILMMVDLIDMIGTQVQSGQYPIEQKPKLFTLPWVIDGDTEDSAILTNSFNIPELFIQPTIGGETYNARLTDLRGGFTDEIFGVSFNVQIYETVDYSGTPMIDARFLFYGDTGANGRPFSIKAIRFEYENDEAVPIFNAGIFSFNKGSGSNFTYKAAGFNESSDTKFSLIVSGQNSGTDREFVMRKRAYKASNTTYADQYVVSTFNVSAGTFGGTAIENSYLGTAFTFDPSNTGGFGNAIDDNFVPDAIASGLVGFATASNMLNILDANLFPSGKEDITPNW